MANKNIATEKYPKTITEILQKEASRSRVDGHPHRENFEDRYLKDRLLMGISDSSRPFRDDWEDIDPKTRISLSNRVYRPSTSPRVSRYDFSDDREYNSRRSTRISTSRSVSPLHSSYDVIEEIDLKARINMGARFLHHTNSIGHSSFEDSISTATELSQSNEDIHHGIIKKEGHARKQLRVLFRPHEIEWRRSSPTFFPHVPSSVHKELISKRIPVPMLSEERRPSEKPKSGKAKPKKSQRNQLSKEWKLKCALQRDQEAGRYNMRQLKEERFQGHAVASIASTSQQCQDNRDEVKILIIGAGLSGLSAAHRLISQNFKRVQILEALDRVGGRIHSVDTDKKPGGVMELGAPGINHFETWNTVFTLASRNGLMEGLFDDEMESTEVHTFYGGDTKLSEAVHSEASMFSRALEGSNGVIKRLNDVSQGMKINLSYRDYVREVTRRLFNSLSRKGTDDRELSELACQMSCYVQDGLCRLGDEKGSAAVQHLTSDTRMSACLYRLHRGMSSLLPPLMKYYKKNTVQFNSEVTRIDWRSVLAGKERLVRVTCENGRVYKAHHVIVTVPLGYLKKQARNIFHPPLSESKLRAIENLEFGSVSKVFLHYPTPFWSKSLNFLWTDDIEVTQDLCDREALKFMALADTTVVEVSTAGTYLDDVCDAYLRTLLTSVLASYLRRQIPQPERITRSRWSTNPLFGGSHPFMGKNSSKKDIEELAAPIRCRNSPIVLFAGDATHHSYTCLTHAARASGLREAKRLEIFYDGVHKFKNTN